MNANTTALRKSYRVALGQTDTGLTDEQVREALTAYYEAQLETAATVNERAAYLNRLDNLSR